MKDEIFYYQDKSLYCEDVPVEKIAAEVGTPFYCYSSAYLEGRFKAYHQAFGDKRHLICFAVKANSNLAVLHTLSSLGAGADIVSGGELFRAIKAGIPSERIVYSGVGKTEAEMAYALQQGILMFNVESHQEMQVLEETAKLLDKTARISIRVNPDVDAKTHPYISTGLKKNKFGLSMDQAIELYREAAGSRWLEVTGISFHIGSQILETEPFINALEKIQGIIHELSSSGIKLSYMDLGGGLGISYGNEVPPEPEDYVSATLKLASGMDQAIIIEPGRSICGNSGILVTKLLYTKKNSLKNFYVVDAAMNDLGRPSLYDAFHEIRPVSEKDNELTTVDVVGPICETGDFLARDRELPRMNRGDLLAVMSAGAYGFTMSSNYNSRPRVAEVMVRGTRFEVVRERETFNDLVRGEKIPDWEENGS
ncbi:MAG: diaminopimelate decarboxylase [Thermodesulfatator sp.]|nr:MAG: diaminopimelate decarboxylase [Thermodesulfatator sp.]